MFHWNPVGFIDVNVVVTRLQIKGKGKVPLLKHKNSCTKVFILKFVFPKELVKIPKVYNQAIFSPAIVDY